MAHPEIYANRDGTESISNAKHRWKDLGL